MMSDKDVENSSCCLNVLECEIKGLPWDFAHGLSEPSDYVSTAANWVPEKFLGTLAENLEAYIPTGSAGFKCRPASWNDYLGLSFLQISDLLENGEVEFTYLSINREQG
jgi:hypothetical protein